MGLERYDLSIAKVNGGPRFCIPRAVTCIWQIEKYIPHSLRPRLIFDFQVVQYQLSNAGLVVVVHVGRLVVIVG